MNKKDLAKEYLTKAKENAIYFKDGKFPNVPLYQERDIEAAFNAGRESVVENIPRLLFKESREGLMADNGIFEFIYHIYKSASVDTTIRICDHLRNTNPMVRHLRAGD